MDLARMNCAGAGPFDGLSDFIARTAVPREAVENLVRAGASDSLTLDRRAALWEADLLRRTAGAQRAAPAGRSRPG